VSDTEDSDLKDLTWVAAVLDNLSVRFWEMGKSARQTALNAGSRATRIEFQGREIAYREAARETLRCADTFRVKL
jgi:hypothetical protein